MKVLLAGARRSHSSTRWCPSRLLPALHLVRVGRFYARAEMRHAGLSSFSPCGILGPPIWETAKAFRHSF